MFERVKILKPMLQLAYETREPTSWPRYDGATLDRAQFVTASEIGRCARQVWFGKHVTPSQGSFKDWGFIERGHSHEAWIVEQLRRLEDKTDYAWTYIGKDQVSFHDKHQSGTPDGLLHLDGQVYVVDFKSIDPRTKVSALPKPEHRDQLVQNMDLVAHCLEIEVAGALIAYSDASDYNKIYEWMIDASNPQVGELMSKLEARAEHILTATSAEQLEPEGIYRGQCTYCAFKEQCNAAVEQQKVERVNHDKAKQASTGIFG